MKKSLAILAAALLAPASAFSFAHTWDIQEVYTNADGSVQFIEFFTLGGSELFLNGTRVFTTGSAPLVLDHDLSGSSAGKTFLVGTANLGTLFGVTPDFTISAGFLTAAINNIVQNQDSGGNPFDTVRLDNLPSNGLQSLNGVVANDDPTVTSINNEATPKNFAGQTAVIPEPSVTMLGLGGLLFMAAARRWRARRA